MGSIIRMVSLGSDTCLCVPCFSLLLVRGYRVSLTGLQLLQIFAGNRGWGGGYC